MEIVIVKNDFDPKIWNKAAIHPLQSWEWGEARKKINVEVLRIAQYANKQINNVFQITLHLIPYTKYKIGYLPRSVWPSNDILSFLLDYFNKNNIIFIKIEPYEEISKLKTQSASWRTKLNLKYLNLRKSSHPLFPEWTQILDLTKSEDELLKNMKSKTRYNIKLAFKKGVTVKEMSNDEGFKIFSKLYFDTCKRQKYFGHSSHYHQIVWNALNKEIAHILIAFYHETPLAAYELFYFGETLYYPYGGTSMEHRNLMAANLLMWEAIRFGKKTGAKKFDMWGSLPPQYDQKGSWSGFTRFKEGYGTDFVQMTGSYDLVIKPELYTLYNITNKIRNILLKFKA